MQYRELFGPTKPIAVKQLKNKKIIKERIEMVGNLISNMSHVRTPQSIFYVHHLYNILNEDIRTLELQGQYIGKLTYPLTVTNQIVLIESIFDQTEDCEKFEQALLAHEIQLEELLTLDLTNEEIFKKMIDLQHPI